MQEKNRTILVIAIAITVFAAVFVSFGLPSLTGGTPKVTLPDLSQGNVSAPGEGYLPVEVTPETVQGVIATLARPESYYREATVTLSWSGGSSSDQVRIWADEGYVKTVISSAGTTQHRLVGEGKLYLWYAGDRTWKETAAQADSADLAQRIPTYEDVLALDGSDITASHYQRLDDRDCIYVEVADETLNTSDCYWIETATGLLYMAQTMEGDRTVYQMKETALETPVSGDGDFSLPDGTVLHESSAVAVQKENGG